MTLFDPDLLFSKADEFDSSLRGYQKSAVAAYLGRIALAVEAAGSNTNPVSYTKLTLPTIYPV